jgi:tetratricopeptide (TPR) repeat protein
MGRGEKGLVQFLLLSDNPFRALGTGSGLDILSLRRQADNFVKRAKIGLASEPALVDFFGPVIAGDLPNVVRSLQTDTKLRTSYRLLWPLSESSLVCLDDPSATQDRPILLEEYLQVEFICAWILYLSRKLPADAENSLQSWTDLYNCQEMDSRLANLLVSEDDLEEEEALAVVYQAQNEVAASILRQVAFDAKLQWEKGDLAKGIRLLKAILDSPIDDELEERALEPLAELATRLQSEVDMLVQEFPDWKKGDSTLPPREVLRLERLAETMEGRHPSARDWAANAHKWSDALLERVYDQAIELLKGGEFKEAEHVLHEALMLCKTSEQINWIKSEIEAFDEAIYLQVQRLRQLAVSRFKAGDPVTAQKITQDALVMAKSEKQKAKLRQDLENLDLIVKTKATGRTARATGNRQAASARQGSAKPKAKPEAILGWGLLILVMMGLATTYWPEPPSSRMPNGGTGATMGTSESTWTPPTRPEMPSSSSASSEVYEPIEQAAERLEAAPSVALEREMNRLADELERLQRDVKRSSERLEAERQALESLKSDIDSMDPDPYSQVEIDAYNALVKEYERQRAKFNGSVESHNAQVQREKDLVRQHNDIVAKLNSGR